MTWVFVYNTYRYDFYTDCPHLPSPGQRVFIPAFKSNGEPLYVDFIAWHPYPPYPSINIHLRDIL